MVVTIGLAQLLAGLGVAIPFLLGADFPPQQLPVPFDFSFDLNGYIFHANDADRDHHHGRGDRRALRLPSLHQHRHRAPGELRERGPRRRCSA